MESSDSPPENNHPRVVENLQDALAVESKREKNYYIRQALQILDVEDVGED